MGGSKKSCQNCPLYWKTVKHGQGESTYWITSRLSEQGKSRRTNKCYGGLTNFILFLIMRARGIYVCISSWTGDRRALDGTSCRRFCRSAHSAWHQEATLPLLAKLGLAFKNSAV